MENKVNIVLIIAVCTIGLTLLIVIIILFSIKSHRSILIKENKIQQIEKETQISIFKAASEAEDKLKENIARNIHDSITPMLAVLKYSLTGHQSLVENNDQLGVLLNEDKLRIDRVVEDLRAICYDLVPPSISDFGVLKSLQALIETINKSGVITASFENLANIDLNKIGNADQINIYRICSELLNNIIKHSNVTELRVVASLIGETLTISFMHNGIGISNEEISELSKKGLGLSSLKSRVMILAAKLDYYKESPVSKIVLQIPVKP